MFRKIFYFFLQGLLFTVPTALTLYVIIALLAFIDQLLPKILPFEINFPGIGLIILFGSITIIGVLGNTVIAQPINRWFNKLLEKAPLVKTIYMAIVDLTEVIVGGKKKKYTQPVLVKLSDVVEKPGFITKEDLTSWGIEADKVMVYLPHSYGFTGNVFVVPKKNVRPIKAKSSEMMKTILSGGVADSHTGEKT
ncbi:MAG: hypothetical protein CL840_07730 [Crocinitomicaceae bacterium]|nr:hypothetical protein [Crocinitomicaceae bacterium]|tara:strand:- start:2152 stop:2733 length:582 start_codon:yes stop_codon:yes gene_type:complete